MNKSIAILGYCFGMNYGSHLTNYAMYKYLKNKGYNVDMYDITIQANCNYAHPPLFWNDPYEIGVLHNRVSSKKELEKINNKHDIFIGNSDQQFHNWVYNITGKTASLDFINSNKRKIIYAGSYGNDNKDQWIEEDRAYIAHFLNEIDLISQWRHY